MVAVVLEVVVTVMAVKVGESDSSGGSDYSGGSAKINSPITQNKQRPFSLKCPITLSNGGSGGRSGSGSDGSQGW